MLRGKSVQNRAHNIVRSRRIDGHAKVNWNIIPYSLALRRGYRLGRCRYVRPLDTRRGRECLCGRRRRSCSWWSRNNEPSWPPWRSGDSALRRSPCATSSWCCSRPDTASATSIASPADRCCRRVGNVTTTWWKTTARGKPETDTWHIRVQQVHTLKHAKQRRCCQRTAYLFVFTYCRFYTRTERIIDVLAFSASL